MRILIFAWVIVVVACILHMTHAGETKRKKLVLVVPEKIRHIHHHHVKKIYIKSKSPHFHSSVEDGLHREDSVGSFEDDLDVGAIKTKSRHHKRHSGRHEHKEESKKVVVHSEEIPEASDWHPDKSTEVRHTHSEHATAASILSKLASAPKKSSSESSSEEEQRTVVFLDSDSINESPRGHVKTVHHHHHHHSKEKSPANTESRPEAPRPQEQRPQTLESRPQNIINHAPERPPNRPPHLHEPRPQNHQEPIQNHHEPIRPPNLINYEPNRPHVHINHGGKPPLQRGKPFHDDKKPGRNSTFIENLVPPPVKQQTFTRVVHGSSGYSHVQPGSHPNANQNQNQYPNQNHPPGRPGPPLPAKTINGPVPQNTPTRAAPPGNHGPKSSFFHNRNQQTHLWTKR